ncbi:MAG: threonine ammonia-lyase [Tepidiformaceae bacterium]
MSVTLAAVQAARRTIAADIRVTPTWHSVTFSDLLGVPVYLKCEQMQRAGSFKIRGAANFVASLSPADRVRGLVAASAGNHAQGLALAAHSRGVDVTVVIPADAPLAKANATRSYGARVVLHGDGIDAARDRALEIAESESRIYVPPFDDDRIIAGQGTVALELLEQLPDVEEVLVPAGGGGLLAGIALALKSLAPHVRVIGVQTAAVDGLRRAFSSNTFPPPAPSRARTLADGAAVPSPSQRTFDLIARHVDDIVVVNEDAIATAIVMLLERSKMIVEGAGALGVAALLAGVYRPGGKTAVVLSGGNIDINLLGSIVRHGLVQAGRYQHLTVEVSDTPGQLALITTAIADAGGNVLGVDHNREAPGMPVGVAVVDLLIEVNGPEHFERVIQVLRSRGLRGSPGIRARLQTEGARLAHPRSKT